MAIMDHPHYSPFSAQRMSGLVSEHDESSYELQCFPLYSLIMALGNQTINYFSLDIEGSEYLVIIGITILKFELDFSRS